MSRISPSAEDNLKPVQSASVPFDGLQFIDIHGSGYIAGVVSNQYQRGASPSHATLHMVSYLAFGLALPFLSYKPELDRDDQDALSHGNSVFDNAQTEMLTQFDENVKCAPFGAATVNFATCYLPYSE